MEVLFTWPQMLTSYLDHSASLLGALETVFLTSKSIRKLTRKFGVLVLSKNPRSDLQFAQVLEGIFLSSTSLSECHLKAFPFVYIPGKSFHHIINSRTFPIHFLVFFQIGGEVGWDEEWKRQGWLERCRSFFIVSSYKAFIKAFIIVIKRKELAD